MIQIENNHPQETAPPELQQLLGETTQKAKKLKAEADEAVHTQKVWEDLLRYLQQGYYFHVRHLLEKEAALLTELQVENHPAFAVIEAIRQEAQDKVNQLLRRYPARLEEACRQRELAIDPDSRHPRYNFNGGFFKLVINESKGLALLSDYEGKLAEIPADVDEVVATVLQERKRLFDRPFQGKKFLKMLHTQYLAVLKKEGQPEGSAVPIRQITARLGKNQKGFRTDEFFDRPVPVGRERAEQA